MCPCKKEDSIFNSTTNLCMTCGRYNANHSYGQQAEQYIESLPNNYKENSITTEDGTYVPYYNKVNGHLVFLNQDGKYVITKEDDLDNPIETFEFDEFPKVLGGVFLLATKINE